MTAVLVGLCALLGAGAVWAGWLAYRCACGLGESLPYGPTREQDEEEEASK